MDIVAVLTKVVKEQRAIEEHHKLAQAQQKIITELKEQFIPELSHEFKQLKQEVRMTRTTALAD